MLILQQLQEHQQIAQARVEKTSHEWKWQYTSSLACTGQRSTPLLARETCIGGGAACIFLFALITNFVFFFSPPPKIPWFGESENCTVCNYHLSHNHKMRAPMNHSVFSFVVFDAPIWWQQNPMIKMLLVLFIYHYYWNNYCKFNLLPCGEWAIINSILLLAKNGIILHKPPTVGPI